MPSCKICGEKSRAKGLCAPHYDKLWRYGDANRKPVKTKPVPELLLRAAILHSNGLSERAIVKVIGITRHHVRAAINAQRERQEVSWQRLPEQGQSL